MLNQCLLDKLTAILIRLQSMECDSVLEKGSSGFSFSEFTQDKSKILAHHDIKCNIDLAHSIGLVENSIFGQEKKDIWKSHKNVRNIS